MTRSDYRGPPAFTGVSDNVLFLFLQPVADMPFTFETELDDLPKEKLKCTFAFCKCARPHLLCVPSPALDKCCCFHSADMIYEETQKRLNVSGCALSYVCWARARAAVVHEASMSPR